MASKTLSSRGDAYKHTNPYICYICGVYIIWRPFTFRLMAIISRQTCRRNMPLWLTKLDRFDQIVPTPWAAILGQKEGMLSTLPRLFPSNGPAPSADAAGFRLGKQGTHSSRTLMFDDLDALFATTGSDATREDYATAIIEMNCLAKPTVASRRLTNQRIGELFALDPAVPLFRVFRRLWALDQRGRRLLAVLCAIARDPLLAATVDSILLLEPGTEFQRGPTTESVGEVVGDRMNASVLAKVVRNAASTWTQSGHLVGRTFKKRQIVEPTACAVAFSLYLGHAVGFRGADLFSSAWMAILDCSPPKGRDLALEAKRTGLLDMRVAGNVIELNLDRLDPAATRN